MLNWLLFWGAHVPDCKCEAVESSQQHGSCWCLYKNLFPWLEFRSLYFQPESLVGLIAPPWHVCNHSWCSSHQLQVWARQMWCVFTATLCLLHQERSIFIQWASFKATISGYKFWYLSPSSLLSPLFKTIISAFFSQGHEDVKCW